MALGPLPWSTGVQCSLLVHCLQTLELMTVVSGDGAEVKIPPPPPELFNVNRREVRVH